MSVRRPSLTFGIDSMIGTALRSTSALGSLVPLERSRARAGVSSFAVMLRLATSRPAPIIPRNCLYAEAVRLIISDSHEREANGHAAGLLPSSSHLMIDPLRSEINTAPGQVPEHEREARVEELLLGGLDHYFAGHYDLAINVWTRVLFLDRGHARARAYIERARGALAERQREGEELIQTGADAFERGESETARRLLIAAVEHGAGTEEAIALLARLDRLAAAGVKQERRPDAIAPSIQGGHEAAARSTGSWITWTVGGAIAGATVV